MLENLSVEELKKLNSAVNEACDSLARQQGEVDLRKEIADRMKEELEVKSSDFNGLVQERFKEKFTNAIAKAEEIVALNEELNNLARQDKGTHA